MPGLLSCQNTEETGGPERSAGRQTQITWACPVRGRKDLLVKDRKLFAQLNCRGSVTGRVRGTE